MLAGFDNPIFFLIDWELADREGCLQIKYSLPYSDINNLSEEQRQKRIRQGLPMEHGHTMEDQIGGQTRAGFVITDFYEDSYSPEEDEMLSRHIATFFVTRAVKP
jgi:hypothetical protein